MPKELIHPYTSDVPTQAYVGWERDVIVQVGVEKTGDYNEPKTPRPHLVASLDRKQVNDLIRKLRKARDAAYGVDA